MKYYAVVSNENKNGDHFLSRFANREEADAAAKESNGKLYEYNQPLKEGEDHNKGKLIADYSATR